MTDCRTKSHLCTCMWAPWISGNVHYKKSGFKTQRRRHQKCKSGVPVAAKKDMCPPKTIFKKSFLIQFKFRNLIRIYRSLNVFHTKSSIIMRTLMLSPLILYQTHFVIWIERFFLEILPEIQNRDTGCPQIGHVYVSVQNSYSRSRCPKTRAFGFVVGLCYNKNHICPLKCTDHKPTLFTHMTNFKSMHSTMKMVKIQFQCILYSLCYSVGLMQ